MQVAELKGEDVVCVIKNSATLAGSLFTLHISQIRIDLPTLTDADKNVSGCIYELVSLLYLESLSGLFIFLFFSFVLSFFFCSLHPCWFRDPVTLKQEV